MANSVNIPQANSVETLVYVVEALRDGVNTVEALVREFQVRERTVHYYLELAEWLEFVADRQSSSITLTAHGLQFANDVASRGPLYRESMMRRELVAEAMSRSAGTDYDSLRAAFIEVILGMEVLAEATAKRRAGALATLVEAALAHASVDWSTGRIGPPTRMRRTYAAHDAPPSEEDETSTFERARDPEALVGEERFTSLESKIAAILEDVGPAGPSQIRDELSLRWAVPLTDPSIFVVLGAGLDTERWRRDQEGRYSLA